MISRPKLIIPDNIEVYYELSKTPTPKKESIIFKFIKKLLTKNKNLK